MKKNNNQWTAFVPARVGSKGLPKKNIRLLANKPLYLHAVDLALRAGASQVIVSTDIPEILCRNFSSEVYVLKRPAELCGDDVPMMPVLMHALKVRKVQGPLVILQPTSPLRQVVDIHAALNQLDSGLFDLIMSVTEADKTILKCGMIDETGLYSPLTKMEDCFSNRQSLPNVYKPNGAVYAMQSKWLSENESFITTKVGTVIMPTERSHDIDNQTDFDLCERLLPTSL